MGSDDCATKRRTPTSHDSSEEIYSQLSAMDGYKLCEHVGYSQHGESALSALNLLSDESLASPTAVSYAHPFLHPSKRRDFQKLSQILPSPEIVQQLIEVFFNEANWYFAVLDKYFFDSMYRRWLTVRSEAQTTDAASLEVLHFVPLLVQVMALAMQFLSPGHACERLLGVRRQEERDEMSGSLSETGEALMNLLERRLSTITSVQADLMRCAWLKNDGRGSEAWYSLGNAVRQAQELKIHRETDVTMNANETTAETLRDLWYDQHKRRLWVTLFIWESHMSLQLGRPRLINVSDCTLTDPIDCDLPLEPARTLVRVPEPDERPSSFTLQLVKFKIGCMIHRMLSTGATSPILEDYSIVQSLQDDLSHILASLPRAMQVEKPDTSWDLMYPGLVKQRLQISIVVFSFQLALHRTHASRHVSSRQMAKEAAIRTLEASHELFERSQPHHHKIYTLVFYTIDSGIFLAVTAIKHYTAASEERQRIFRSLKQAVGRLSVLKDRNIAAQHGEKVLEKCIQKFRQRWSDHTTFLPAPLSGNDTLMKTALTVSNTNTSVSPGISPPVDHEAITDPIENDPSLGRDIFNEVSNVMLSTTSWLEHMDMISMLNLRIDEGEYIWDSLFQ